jgi:hypothetical protein
MNVKSGNIAVVVGVLVVSFLLVGAAGALPARAPGQPGDHSLAQSIVSETIGYQGYLTDSDGDPLTGTYTMRFELFRQLSGGAPVFESGPLTVAVSNGLFHIGLDVPQSLFDGGPLWLAIIVNAETLSPRQQIRPAPYAMSLRPGATVRQVATGTAVQVESTEGIGLHGAGRVYGLYGTNTGAAQGSGYGGYFESTTGIGVYGQSTAQSSGNNLYAPGVQGHSTYGVGVYGTSDSAFSVGVFGRVATGYGVHGISDGIGTGGVGQAYGVYGASAAPTQGSGYGGYFVSNTGIGVHGESTAQLSGNNLYAPGVSGYSQHGVGIYAQSGIGVAGYLDGDLIVTGSKFGYVVDLARNDGDDPLAQGDLVVVTGVTDPVVGEIPVPLVRKADTEASTAVIGVVDAAYRLAEHGLVRTAEGAINPGDYLTVVTLGAFATLRADATYGAIQPGDLLVSSPTPGHAMRAGDPQVGTVVGKALGALDAGTGSIPVLVTLQ